jgi:N-acyl-D-aspartate/D-glutamate deacylase
VLGRPTGIMLGFENSQHPFVACPSYQAIAHLAFPQRIAALRQPELRARILAEATPGRTTTTRESALPAASRESASPMTTRESALPGTSRAPALPMTSRVRAWDRIFPLGDPPDYEPPAERSLGARARAMGVDPAALAYDTLLEHDGHTILYRPLSNYARGNLDTAREMMTHPNTLLGLGDGGAHVSVLCDASAPTSMLTHWTRDRRTGRFPVEWAIKRLTRDNALAMGLADRGLLAPGMKADLNVIDYDHLTLHAPHVVYDLPAGGRRLMQDADGYVATIVSGVVTARDGTPTGALPGRLIRGAKQAASG